MGATWQASIKYFNRYKTISGGGSGNGRHPWFKDPSVWMLIFSNLVTVIYALAEHWSLLQIMWIYWTQSLIIGLFNFIRILMLKNYSTEGFKIDNQKVFPTTKTKTTTALFFAGHYGFFHLVYAVFLFTLSGWQLGRGFSEINPELLVIPSLVFFFNHLFSFVYNRQRDCEKQNLGRVMAYPYARILPMHFALVFGFFWGTKAIVFFLLLKIVADVLMHSQEHA